MIILYGNFRLIDWKLALEVIEIGQQFEQNIYLAIENGKLFLYVK